MPAIALVGGVPWALVNAYQDSLIPAGDTTEPHVFGAIANWSLNFGQSPEAPFACVSPASV